MINREMARDEAVKLIKQFKTTDPWRICKELDIDVLELDLGGSTLGQSITNRRCSVILIEENMTEAWKRFVLAHELAHCRLHKGFSTAFYRQTTAFKMINWVEMEANLFAMALLKEGVEENEKMTDYQLLDYLGLPYELGYFLD